MVRQKPTQRSQSSSSTSVVNLTFPDDTSSSGPITRSKKRSAQTTRLQQNVSQPSQKDHRLSDQETKKTDQANWWKRSVRAIGLLSTISTLLYVPTLRTQGLKNGFGGGTQYLTIVGLILTIITLLIGVVEDASGHQRWTRYKNALLPVIAPVQCAVAGLYWYLVLDDVYHIYPDGHRYLPFWLDIQMHGFPFVFVLVEMFYFSESFRVRRLVDFRNVALFAVAYIGWSSLCAHMDGEWPYPVLQNIECPWKRLRHMGISSVIGLCMHVAISEAHIRSVATKAVKKASARLSSD